MQRAIIITAPNGNKQRGVSSQRAECHYIALNVALYMYSTCLTLFMCSTDVRRWPASSRRGRLVHSSVPARRTRARPGPLAGLSRIVAAWRPPLFQVAYLQWCLPALLALRCWAVGQSVGCRLRGGRMRTRPARTALLRARVPAFQQRRRRRRMWVDQGPPLKQPDRQRAEGRSRSRKGHYRPTSWRVITYRASKPCCRSSRRLRSC